MAIISLNKAIQCTNIFQETRTNKILNGRVERLSELESENLIACPELDSGSRLWEGLWERIMLKVCIVESL
jgi:hypothetical protein